jgi:hypothetical protein
LAPMSSALATGAEPDACQPRRSRSAALIAARRAAPSAAT